jgi:hypothetical protein
MKTLINYRFIFLIIVSVIFLSMNVQNAYAQEPKKNTVRLKADYVKTMNKEVAFNLRASSKVDGSNIDVPDIELTVFNEYNDEKVKLGSTITDSNGKGTFVVNDLSLIKPDSTGLYNISVSFKGNDAFKRASKSLSYKDASIEARIITEDSIHYITATLKDAATDSVLPDQYLNVQVERLFKSLRIGEEFNTTDENGTIIVPIEEGIPGVDGILTFEVVLKDSDDYGTVKALVSAPLGVPVVDESTFDQRTMWSPKNKTPLFLLIFPNILILGIWGLIVYLIINLFKISKSKI